MTNYLRDIQDRLEKGFYADNFRDIGRVGASAAEAVEHPLPFFLISRMFFSLDNFWREFPMEATTAQQMAETLQPPLKKYLDAAQAGLSPELEVEYLDDIVRAFISWGKVQHKLKYQ